MYCRIFIVIKRFKHVKPGHVRVKLVQYKTHYEHNRTVKAAMPAIIMACFVLQYSVEGLN